MSQKLNFEQIELYIKRYPETTVPQVLGRFLIDPDKKPEIKLVVESVSE